MVRPRPLPTLLYAGAVYAAFLAALAGFVAFLADADLPRTVDRGPAASLPEACARDLGWFVAFGVQHSAMARARFKAGWTRVIPPVAERSTFVLASTLMFVALPWAWRPLPQVVWHLEAPLARAAVHAVTAAGWALVAASTFLIDHLELFGLRQALRHARGQAPPDGPFVTPSLYRVVRHPMYLGLLVAAWATPTMTAGHLLLAAGLTAYVQIGVRFEERDLVRRFGDAYRQYQARVGRVLPRPWR